MVVVAGTTNGYVAGELLGVLGQRNGLSRNTFFRGITTPPNVPRNEMGRLFGGNQFPGDVVIAKGKRQVGKTIFEPVDQIE